MQKNTNFYQTLRLLIVIVFVFGVFIRFVNLDRKVYWHDETFTSLRISGYTGPEVVQQLFDGHLINRDDLRKYQQPNPEKTLIDTVKHLALAEPQHPPIYYLLVREWAQIVGSSVAAIRSLSAVISLLAFPCLYWLCLELFDSPLVRWVAIALFAVSPFHLLYAQEAREYSLWTVTILLSSAVLLRAMRLNTKLSWVIYASTVAVGLYSFLLSVLVAVAHGIYVTITERYRLTSRLIGYLLSSLAGFLVFVPWLWMLIAHTAVVDSKTGWTATPIGLLSLVKIWILNLGRIFVDGDFSAYNPLTYFVIPIVILVGYAIYFLYRNTPQQVWLFILTLIGVTALVFVLPDLILGGRRSTVPRYLIPTYLGFQLAVAYLFTFQITSISNSLRRKKLWQIALMLLISLGVISCGMLSQAYTWWNKFEDNQNVQIARLINQAPQPLVISDAKLAHIMCLSYLLTPKVQLMLLPEPSGVELNLPKIPDNFTDTFLFKPTKVLRDRLKKEYKVKPVVNHQGRLWNLEKS